MNDETLFELLLKASTFGYPEITCSLKYTERNISELKVRRQFNKHQRSSLLADSHKDLFWPSFWLSLMLFVKMFSSAFPCLFSNPPLFKQQLASLA